MKRISKILPLFLAFAFVLVQFQWESQAAAPSVTAQAAIVVEATTGKALYDKNADTMMVPASMTKVMTAYIIFEELYKGTFTLDTKVPITQAHRNLASTFGGSIVETFPAGTTVSVDTLLKMIIVPSSCVAAIIMAEYIAGSEWAFVQRMNETALRLSMTATYENCHGYFPHYLTARSQARLVQVFLQDFPSILDYTSLTSVNYNGNSFSNTNQLLHSNYYYEGVTGFKTGTNTAGGHCLTATAERNGVEMIVVVLKSDGTAARYQDSTALLNYGFSLVDASYTYFNDTVNQSVAPLYEKYRQLKVNLQSRHGWVRPADIMTRGEFAVTLVSVLEQTGLLPQTNTQLSNSPQIADLEDYQGKETILRGIAQGVIPYEGGDFQPHSPLTQEMMSAILAFASGTLGSDVFLPESSGGDFTIELSSTGLYSALILPYLKEIIFLVIYPNKIIGTYFLGYKPSYEIKFDSGTNGITLDNGSMVERWQGLDAVDKAMVS